jgi:predicted outer membrane protein
MRFIEIMENKMKNNNIFGVVCCTAFCLFLTSYYDVSAAVSSGSKKGQKSTLLKRGYKYNDNGKLVYDPSDSYNRKFARSSHPEVADAKNASFGDIENDAMKLPLSERLEGNLVEELEKEARRCKKNTDGKYVDNYVRIHKNALLLVRKMILDGSRNLDISEDAENLIASAISTFCTLKDLNNIEFYMQINKNMADSQMINILEIPHMIESTKLAGRTAIKNALESWKKFKKENRKTIDLLLDVQKHRKTKINFADFPDEGKGYSEI